MQLSNKNLIGGFILLASATFFSSLILIRQIQIRKNLDRQITQEKSDQLNRAPVWMEENDYWIIRGIIREIDMSEVGISLANGFQGYKLATVELRNGNYCKIPLLIVKPDTGEWFVIGNFPDKSQVMLNAFINASNPKSITRIIHNLEKDSPLKISIGNQSEKHLRLNGGSRIDEITSQLYAKDSMPQFISTLDCALLNSEKILIPYNILPVHD